MTEHDEVAELLGAYALNAVDEAESTRVEDHLRSCALCQAEVDEHRDTAAFLANSGGTAPAGVWDRIAAELDPDAPEMRIEVNGSEPATVVPLDEHRRRKPFASTLAKGIMSAAAVIIVVLGAMVVRLDARVDQIGDDEPAQVLEDAATAALADPDSRTSELTDASGQQAAPVAVTADGEGYLLPGQFPDLADERTYQLWGVDGERTISLGTFEPDDRVVAFGASEDVESLAVTNEQDGGVAVSDNPPIASTEI